MPLKLAFARFLGYVLARAGRAACIDYFVDVEAAESHAWRSFTPIETRTWWPITVTVADWLLTASAERTLVMHGVQADSNLQPSSYSRVAALLGNQSVYDQFTGFTRPLIGTKGQLKNLPMALAFASGTTMNTGEITIVTI